MPKRLPGFEERFAPIAGEEYIGKWVIIFNKTGNQSFAGQIKAVTEDYYILNPSQGFVYSEGKKQLEMMSRDEKIPVEITGPIEETTKESL
jgi:hypothetical protein